MIKPNLNQLLVATLISGLMFCPKVWADDTAQLESQLANKQQANMPTMMPAYDQWEDPFAQMLLMQQQMDRNMHKAFADLGMFSPKMDMKQTNLEYIITMDIPGMHKNKINIETKDGMLTISGERKSETENSIGTFMQAIPLPDDALAGRINAKYNNGVLTVTVARTKKEEKRPEGEKITVQ